MSPNQIPPPPAVSRHRLRWLVPSAVAFSLLVGFGFGPALVGTGASADPILPTISAQDLVAKVVAGTAPAFSGTVQTHTNLGLPSLGSLGQNGTGLLSTVLSPHTIKVSARPADGMFHVAIPDGLSETDVVSDGSQVWVWQSSNQTVTHLAKQADPAEPSAGESAKPDDGVEPTPDAIAKELLANADPSTRVFVRGTASVAGRDAYELVLAPTSTATLVADVVIDVDAATGLPLRAQVLAKDSGTPALDIGFTSISFAAQPDSAFTFTAPPGAKVVEATSPEELLFGAGGQDDGAHRRPGDQKGAVVAPSSSVGTPAPGAPEARTRVLGSGWDAVAAIPNGAGTFADVGRPVSGAWGSGKLITSTLADALVLDDGTVLVGMVGADRLEAAVGDLRAGS